MDNKRVVMGGAVFAIILLAILFYVDQIGVPGTGTILLSGAPEGAVIFLDNKQHSRVKDTDTISFKNLEVGTHSIVVAKDAYWPWSKTLIVTDNARIVINSFAVPQEPQQAILNKNNGNYEKVFEALRDATPPSAERPLSSVDGKVTIWINQNTIWAQWDSAEDPPAAFCITGTCEETLRVLQANERIENLAFFPNRNDVLLFSSTEGIFAIETDKRDTQNFQPLYLGSKLQFVVIDQETIAVRDNKTIVLIHLP